MSDERRQYTRVPSDVIVRMHFSTIGEFMQSQAENISLGGMQLTTSRPLAVGDLIGLEFRLTSNYPLIEGTASVKWCRPAGANFQVGVEFGQLDERSRRVIDEAVRHQERNAAELTEDLLVSPDGPDDVMDLPDDALDIETADLEPAAAPARAAARSAAPEPWDVEEVVAEDIPSAEAFDADGTADGDWGDVTFDEPTFDAPAAAAEVGGASETFDFGDVSAEVADLAPPASEPARSQPAAPLPGTFDFGAEELVVDGTSAAADGGAATGAYSPPDARAAAATRARPRVLAPGGLRNRRALIGVVAVAVVAVVLILWGLLPREETVAPVATAPTAAPVPRPRAPRPATDVAAPATVTAAAMPATSATDDLPVAPVEPPVAPVAEPAAMPAPEPKPAPAAKPAPEPKPAPAAKPAPEPKPVLAAKPEPAAPSARPTPAASATAAAMITAVRGGSGSTLVTIEGDGGWQGRYRSFALKNPARIVIDLSDVALAKGLRAPAGGNGVDGVRIGRHEDKIRIVLDMPSDTPYSVDVEGDRLHVRRR